MAASHHLRWFWSPRKLSVTVSYVSPSICHEVMGSDAMIFIFCMLSFKSAFSLSSFIFMKMKVAQWCPTLCNLMDYTIHGILLVRILEWLALSFSRGSSQPRDRAQVSCIAGGFFTSWATCGWSLSSRGSLILLCFLPLRWCHLHIWDYWYFFWQSWFQLVLHPVRHFAWLLCI